MSALAKQLMRLKASAHAMSAIEKDLHLIAITRERLNRGRSVGGRQAANEMTQRQGAQASRGAFSNVQAEKTALRECVAMLQRAARGGARGSRRWRLSRCGVTNSLLQGWAEVLKEATTTTVESSGRMSMNGDSKPLAKGTFSRGLAKRQRVSRSVKQGRRAADATAVSTVRSELGDALHIAAGVMHRQREKLIAREVTACLEGLGAFLGADQAPRPLLGKHALQSSSLLHLPPSLQQLGESAGRASPAADESEEQNAIGDDLESVVGEWSGAVTAVDSSQGHHTPAPVPAEKVAHTHHVSALLQSSGKSNLLASLAKHVLVVVRGARAAVRGGPSSVRQRRWIVPAAEALEGLAQALLSSSSSALRSALADDAEVAATLAFGLQRATLSLADVIIMTPHSGSLGNEGALGSAAAEMECLSKTVQQVAIALDEVIFPQLVGSNGNQHPLGPESVLAVLYAASEWSKLANIANELHPSGRVDPSRWGPELVLAQHARVMSCAGSLSSQQAMPALIATCKALAGAKNRPAQHHKFLPTFAALLRSALPAFVPAVEDVPESRLPTLPHQKHGGAHVGKPNPRKRMADAKRREGDMEAAHRTSTTSLVANSLSSLLIANEVLANALAADRCRNSLLDDDRVAVACGIVTFAVSLDAQVDAKEVLAARTLLSQSCATAKKVLRDAEMRQRRTRSHITFEGMVWNPRKVVERLV